MKFRIFDLIMPIAFTAVLVNSDTLISASTKAVICGMISQAGLPIQPTSSLDDKSLDRSNADHDLTQNMMSIIQG